MVPFHTQAAKPQDDPKSYKPMSLLSTIFKLYAKIVEKRLATESYLYGMFLEWLQAIN